jgi:hypothetical protein
MISLIKKLTKNQKLEQKVYLLRSNALNIRLQGLTFVLTIKPYIE